MLSPLATPTTTEFMPEAAKQFKQEPMDEDMDGDLDFPSDDEEQVDELDPNAFRVDEAIEPPRKVVYTTKELHGESQ